MEFEGLKVLWRETCLRTYIHAIEPVFAWLFTVGEVGDVHVSVVFDQLLALAEDGHQHIHVIDEGCDRIGTDYAVDLLWQAKSLVEDVSAD